MPLYKYTGKDAKGKAISGSVVADNEAAAMTKLRGQKLSVATLAVSTGFNPVAMFNKMTQPGVSVTDI